MVEIDGGNLVARATVEVDREDVGREVLVTFLGGDPSAPVITGLFADGEEGEGRRQPRMREGTRTSARARETRPEASEASSPTRPRARRSSSTFPST